MAAPASAKLKVELPPTTHELQGPSEQPGQQQHQQQQHSDAVVAAYNSSAGGELNPADSAKEYSVIVLRFSAKYARSASGILKICQAMFVLVALIFLTTAGSQYAGYLLLPLSWHLRVFVFVTVYCFVFSLMSYFVHVYRLKDALRIDWNKFDFIMYCLQCFGLLFASSLVASTVGYYDAVTSLGVSAAARKHLVIATVLGYVAMFLYAGSAYYAGKQWRALVLQFSPYRFPAQGSSSQPATPTTETPSTGGNIVV